jgi:hypothetical protein
LEERRTPFFHLLGSYLDWSHSSDARLDIYPRKLPREAASLFCCVVDSCQPHLGLFSGEPGSKLSAYYPTSAKLGTELVLLEIPSR